MSKATCKPQLCDDLQRSWIISHFTPGNVFGVADAQKLTETHK